MNDLIQGTARPEDMRWPGLRAKLFPVTVLRLAGWSRPSVHFRNWYHGCWWCLSIGPWLIVGGVGTYD